MTTPIYIIEYAGEPVTFSGGVPVLTETSKADRFHDEPAAWQEARKQNLKLAHVTVRNIADELNRVRKH